MKRIVIFAAVAAIVLCQACGSRNEAKYAPGIAIGSMAPDFALPDTLGGIVTLDDFRGSYVVLDFWASWCGDCRRDIPELKQVFDKYNGTSIAGAPVEFLGISFDHEAESWKSALRSEQFAWPQVSNLIKWKENPVSADFGIKWIPAMIVVAPDGSVAGTAITASRLDKVLGRLQKK